MASFRKSPLRSFAVAIGFGNQSDIDSWDAAVEPEMAEFGETDPEISRLRRTLVALRGGDPQYEALEASAPTETARTQAAAEPVDAWSAAISPAAPNEGQNVETAITDDLYAAPASSGEALSAAQDHVALTRKAAEELLLEVRALEERFSSEAKAAQAAAESAAATQKSEDAALLEREAKELSETAAQNHSALLAELEGVEAVVVTKRADAHAARARFVDLEQQLLDARQAAAQAFAALEQHEARAKECLAKRPAIEREALDAATRFAACQAARAAAENEAKAAEERAEALKASLPAESQGFAGIDEIQALAARIAAQASALGRGQDHSNGLPGRVSRGVSESASRTICATVSDEAATPA